MTSQMKGGYRHQHTEVNTTPSDKAVHTCEMCAERACKEQEKNRTGQRCCSKYKPRNGLLSMTAD